MIGVGVSIPQQPLRGVGFFNLRLKEDSGEVLVNVSGFRRRSGGALRLTEDSGTVTVEVS